VTKEDPSQEGDRRLDWVRLSFVLSLFHACFMAIRLLPNCIRFQCPIASYSCFDPVLQIICIGLELILFSHVVKMRFRLS